ncbi:class I SAM-dependent methyltransferase [Campylobacter concisus]
MNREVCKKCGLLKNFNKLRPEDINSFYESVEYQSICMWDLDDEIHFNLEYKVMSKYFIEIFNRLSLEPSETRIMEIGPYSSRILFALKEWSVSLAKSYDIDSHRIEYSKKFIEELEVLDVLAINSINYDNYILLSNILEHLSGPLIFLKKLSRWLSTDEVKIIIDTLNLETYYVYGNKFNRFLYIGHIWYFSSIITERLLNNAILKIGNIILRKSDFAIICSKNKSFVANANNSYWNSTFPINYTNHMNT